MPRKFNDNAIALSLIALALGFWELSVRLKDVPIYILPAPSRILSTLFQNINLYAEASLLTLGEALAGLMLGSLAGIGAAALLSLWPRLESGIMSLAILVKSTPLIAIAPLLTIWLGFGVLPKIIITGL
ncbi:MAG: ABC transporter permease, partial [Chloroflexota bacterium]